MINLSFFIAGAILGGYLGVRWQLNKRKKDLNEFIEYLHEQKEYLEELKRINDLKIKFKNHTYINN